jgi:hypothetical protein
MNAGMLSQCLIVCTLILAPNVRHFGRNIVVAADETVQNVGCFLCSAELNGHATGSVRVFAGHVFLNGNVGGNILVFGGNLTLTGSATVGGHVFIFGGHLQQGSTTANYPHTVFSPIIFLPVILIICAIIGGLIVLARRMVRGPVAYPPLPRL